MTQDWVGPLPLQPPQNGYWTGGAGWARFVPYPARKFRYPNDESRQAAEQFQKEAAMGDETHDILITEDGAVRYVYSDLLDNVFADEARTTRRASHVEPAPAGGWEADMGPSGGPVLGPFRTRAEGLTAERDWLRANRGL